MFSPLLPIKYAVSTTLLITLTISGMAGSFCVLSEPHKETAPVTTATPSSVSTTENVSKKGNITTDTIKSLSTPTPSPTATPTPSTTPEPSPTPQPKESVVQQQTPASAPEATQNQPQVPVQQPAQSAPQADSAADNAQTGNPFGTNKTSGANYDDFDACRAAKSGTNYSCIPVYGNDGSTVIGYN